MIIISVNKEALLNQLKNDYEKVEKELYDYERIEEIEKGIRSLPYHGPSSIMFRKELNDIKTKIDFVNLSNKEDVLVGY